MTYRQLTKPVIHRSGRSSLSAGVPVGTLCPGISVSKATLRTDNSPSLLLGRAHRSGRSSLSAGVPVGTLCPGISISKASLIYRHPKPT
ncbi:hypothetical protein [Rouxiella sp. Mn2063]|uniref:hypothetical protein n=1 Tax=Rouxiella sp. Mn2063 TaxID=3395262 RepID=UPI003BC3BE31